MSTCGLCHLEENPDQRVVLRDRTELFLQNEKEQGALVGSGVIIPVRHAETVFDLTPDEVAASFALLAASRRGWTSAIVPTATTWGGTARRWEIAMNSHMHVIPRFRGEPYAGRGIRYCLKQPENRRA
jgi:diadenosine tetraphosphate (Ap4A) HIT family hydrolase